MTEATEPIQKPAALPPGVKRARVITWAAVVVVLLAGAGVAYFYFRGPPISAYEPIIQQIQSGQLHDADGAVRLTNDLDGKLANGIAYIRRREGNEFIIFFPTRATPGNRMMYGYLYTTRPLTEADIYNATSTNGNFKPVMDVGPIKRITLDKRFDAHWYKASRGVEGR